MSRAELTNSAGNPAHQKRLRVVGILIVVIGFAANPWAVSLLKPNGDIGPGLAAFMIAFELGLIVLGSIFVFSKRKQTVFRVVLAVVSFTAWGTVLLVAMEIYLATRPDTDGPYGAFHVQYLHPFYFFSLPSGSELTKANNSVVSVSPDGFRGPGPESKGSRKLAFILGGSAAFGDGASTDLTTISGYLNGLQEEYFFVNAGVPSWNSTQEFYRASMQLLKYKPDLILVYDGANDAYINFDYLRDGQTYPPGTPESFDDLSSKVNDIRARSNPPLITFNPSALYAATLPRMRMKIAEKIGWDQEERTNDPKKSISAEDTERGALSYLWNIDNMRRLTAARGTKLVVFWQAISHLHHSDKVDSELSGEQTEIEFLKRFHKYVVDHRDGELQFYDLGNVFDKFSGSVQLRDVFTDPVHLTDQGNRIVATEMWTHLSQLEKR